MNDKDPEYLDVPDFLRNKENLAAEQKISESKLTALLCVDLPDLTWIKDTFGHVFTAKITIFEYEIITIKTDAWHGSVAWLLWRERMIKLANAAGKNQQEWRCNICGGIVNFDDTKPDR